MRQVTPSLIRVINASGDPFSMGTGGLSVGGDIPGNTGEGGSIPVVVVVYTALPHMAINHPPITHMVMNYPPILTLCDTPFATG